MTPLIIAALICILGAVVYLVTSDKVAEVGRAFLWMGALAIVLLLCKLL